MALEQIRDELNKFLIKDLADIVIYDYFYKYMPTLITFSFQKCGTICSPGLLRKVQGVNNQLIEFNGFMVAKGSYFGCNLTDIIAKTIEKVNFKIFEFNFSFGSRYITSVAKEVDNIRDELKFFKHVKRNHQNEGSLISDINNSNIVKLDSCIYFRNIHAFGRIVSTDVFLTFSTPDVSSFWSNVDTWHKTTIKPLVEMMKNDQKNNVHNTLDFYFGDAIKF